MSTSCRSLLFAKVWLDTDNERCQRWEIWSGSSRGQFWSVWTLWVHLSHENTLSWNEMDPQINEYEDNVDWYTGSGKKAHIQLMLRQIHNYLNSFMAIWKTLKRLHHKCTHRRLAVFKIHVSFWLVSRVSEAICPVVGIGAFNGLAQPSTDRGSCKVSWSTQEG